MFDLIVAGVSLSKRLLPILLLCTLMVSCSGKHRPAPLRNLSTVPVKKKLSQPVVYKVRKRDSLYSIAFRYGIDFQQLASINKITRPYTIYPGQILQLQYSKQYKKPKKYTGTSKINSTKYPTQPVKQNKNIRKQQKPVISKNSSDNRPAVTQQSSVFDSNKKVAVWRWPVNNIDMKNVFSGKDGQQAININGTHGELIKAVADGRVVYSGDGLVGYGNLIIIKHSQKYLSAYAHNDKIFVKEKDVVIAGQKIATMGKSATGQVQLHFEIRNRGKPVNPLKYLPSSG